MDQDPMTELEMEQNAIGVAAIIFLVIFIAVPCALMSLAALFTFGVPA